MACWRLAPAGAREEDQLCIPYGDLVPFILRQMPPTTNKYTLVGECFALGLMNGEGLDANRFPSQQFELRQIYCRYAGANTPEMQSFKACIS